MIKAIENIFDEAELNIELFRLKRKEIFLLNAESNLDALKLLLRASVPYLTDKQINRLTKRFALDKQELKDATQYGWIK